MTTLTDDTPDHALARPEAINLAHKRVHFVGIGGCGMSGLARLAQQRRAVCSGTDLVQSDTVAALREAGIDVATEQSAASVPDPCDMLVISAAIRQDHPEVAEAARRGIEITKYAQLLGRLMIGQRGVAVAGTHGKSTTTSLLSHILIQCGLDPSLIVGAECPQIGGGWRVGSSDLLIAEACEYDRSFHNFHPTYGLILNVELDHLDLYSGLDEIVESFAHFARLLPPPPEGRLLIQHELAQRLAITAGLECGVETIGFAPQADWRVETGSRESRVESQESGVEGRGPEGPGVRLYRRGEMVCSWASPMPGEHMAYNAAAAAVTANRLGADWPAVGEAIARFAGLDRRMQYLGTRRIGPAGGVVTVVDDYGHHPTEIDTTLRALRGHYNPGRLVCVFQPHQHSRTRFLIDEFAASFTEADLVIVPHIYFVRDSEKERHAVRAADLVDRLRKRGRSAMHLYPFAAIVEQLELIVRDGDLVVTMGAGDVWQIAHRFLHPPGGE